MLWTAQQLLCLNTCELCKRAVRGLIAPDPLAVGIHWVAAVAFLVVAVVLVTVDDDLIAHFPVLHLVTNGPNDARGVGTRDVVRLAMAIKRGNRFPKACPNAVVVDACGHHEHQNVVGIQFWGFHDLDLEGFLRLAVTLAADRPSIHLFGHIAHRRDFPQLIQVFLRRRVARLAGLCVQSHVRLLAS